MHYSKSFHPVQNVEFTANSIQNSPESDRKSSAGARVIRGREVERRVEAEELLGIEGVQALARRATVSRQCKYNKGNQGM